MREQSLQTLPSCGERAFDALLLLKRGCTPVEIASVLPSKAGPEAGSVSGKSAEIILRQGARVLLSGILRGQPPARLPRELWPPEAVRESIAVHNSWRTRLRALRAWLGEAGTGSQEGEPLATS